MSTAAPARTGARAAARFSLRDQPTLIKLLSVAATLLVWEWYGRGVDPIFFSYPTAIVAALPAMIRSGELLRAINVSLPPFVIGFALAIVSGVLLGLLMGRYRLVDHLLDAQISALYSTPNVALIPLIILWFGLGEKAKIVIIFLSAFFPVIVNTYGGVRNVSKGFVEVGLVERASERQIFSKIIVPAAMPFIMTGIRLSVGRAVVGLVVAEMFTSIVGLGGSIVYYSNQFKTDKLLVVVILLALLGVTLTALARLLERHFASWKESERA